MPLAPTPSAILLMPQTVNVAGGGTFTVPNPQGGQYQGPSLNPGDIYLNLVTAVGVDVHVTGYTGSGNIVVTVDRKSANGDYVPQFSGTAITANGDSGYSAGLGLAGANSVFLGLWIRIRVVAAATVSAGFVVVSVQGA